MWDQVLDAARLVVGGTLVVVATFDFVVTALTVGGRAGPVTLRLADGMHRFLLRRDLRRHPRLGWLLGPLLLLATFLTWLFSISLGWALVFSTEGAIARPEDAVTSLLDPFEFVFATLLGRAGGLDIDTAEPVWTALEVSLGLMGVAFLTLSLAWVLPVVSGVATRREVAAKLAAMGTDAQDVILSAWDGSDLGNLDLHLHTLTSDLATLAQRHLAYPAMHYFHSNDWRTSLGTRFAAVDDAMSLLAMMDATPGLPRSTLVSARRAATDYLDAIGEAFLSREADPPPPPAIDRLRRAGLLDLSDEEVAARLERVADRRARLHAYVLHDGWTWEEAMAGDADRDERIGLDVLAGPVRSRVG